MADIIVTTGDLKENYEVIGPVYFQVNNRLQGFSGKSKLSILEDAYRSIAQSNREKNGLGIISALLLPVGEFGPGDNHFSTAFYIAVEELKKQAKKMGADAVVAMRQDIDIDSNGFQYFYMQMYGTAVRFISKQETMQREKEEEEAFQREEARKEELRRAEEEKKEALRNAVENSGEQMNELFSAMLACEKYSELLALWKNSGLLEKEDFSKYAQQVKSKAEVERLYGVNKTRVRQFIEQLVTEMQQN